LKIEETALISTSLPHFLRPYATALLLAVSGLSAFSHATSFELKTSTANAGQPYYRAALPASVYAANITADSDWTVKNGAGEAVPFALVKPHHAITSATLRNYPLSVFAITQEALSSQGTQLNVELNQAQGQRFATTMRLQAQSKSNQVPVVFLAKTMLATAERDGAIAQIQMKWTGAAGQAIGIEVLTSDDLQTFRSIAQATLMNLHNGQEAIVQDSVVFERPIAPKYLQIRRVSPNGEPVSNGDFVITGIMSSDLVSMVGKPVNTTLTSQTLAPPVVSTSASQTFYDFQTIGRYSAEQLVFGLPQINTITPITVFTRSATSQPWALLTRASVYRLMQNTHETTNPAITFSPHDATHWRIAVNKSSGGLGSGMPSLTLHWQTHTLIWNARGQGPFKLTVGEPQPLNSVVNSLSTLNQLFPTSDSLSLEQTNALIAQLPEANVGTAQQTAAPTTAPTAVTKPVSEPTLRWWLWAGLGLGVLLLAGMAYSLLKANKVVE
jgi:hypothetical protein